MVLRYDVMPQQLFMVEAESDNGVVVKQWSDYYDEPGEFYTKVCLRRLKWKRTEESQKILF